VGERHTAILNLRNSLSQAIKDMAADMETNTARVVLTGPGTAVVYIKAAFPSGDGTGRRHSFATFWRMSWTGRAWVRWSR
jgi:hypothetical protein